MSIRIMSLVWDHGPSVPADRFLLLAIADRADDDGGAWPGLEYLASKCCVTSKTASATVKRLEREEWVSVVRGRGRGRSNRYQINVTRLRQRALEADLEPAQKPPVGGGNTDPVKPPVSDQETPRERAKTPRRPPEDPSVDTPEDPPVGQPALVPEPPKAKARRATAYPADYKPKPEHFTLAASLAVNLQVEGPQFRDHHIAKGSTFKDWDAALRTWIRNAAKFRGGGNVTVLPGASDETWGDDAALLPPPNLSGTWA